MPTHKEVYESHATEYEALIAREDYQGNILKAIQDIISPRSLDVIDLGAGTGRLAGLLAPSASRVLAFDLSAHMLTSARTKLRQASPHAGWLAAAADHRYLPLSAGVADLIVSGWSVSYVATWYPDAWREQVESWSLEAQRVLRPGGTIILFESLGTGNDTPVRLPHLTNFYDWLDERGFRSRWIRTDYRFDSLDEAEGLVSFFFGDDMKQHIRHGEDTTLPECTGVWWRQA